MNKIFQSETESETTRPHPSLQPGEETGLINRWRDPRIARPPAGQWVEVLVPDKPPVIFFGRFRPSFLFFRACWDCPDSISARPLNGTLWRALSPAKQREIEEWMIHSFNDRAW
jgi:hypothetical protein